MARINLSLIAVVIFVMSGAAYGQFSVEKSPNPELVGSLSKGLSITPQQATGGAGAIFQTVKSTVKPDQFAKLAGAVPGMNGFLKAAPKTTTAKTAAPKSSTQSAIESVAGSLPGGIGGIASQAGALAGLAGPFKKLGLSPDMIAQFLPIMGQYVQGKGGADIANIFTGALGK